MTVFNKDSRTKNAIKISILGVISQLIKILLGFGYRTLFLHYLTADYLGINGLFSNVLQILSLAELGITTAIVFRFYEPISRNDVQQVGKLMNFFKKVYLSIAGIILLIGLCGMPFLHLLINEADEIPGDINLHVVYGLFLLNSVSSYLFTYKLTILTADQKNHQFSLIDLSVAIINYVFQIIVLVFTKNYTLTLAVGIASTITVNYGFSIWVTKKYKEVFDVKEVLSKEERKQIFSDTKACMLHKVGATVLTGTDNAVLSKMVSLAATGIYSNYAMLISYIQVFFTRALGNLTASVGNALQEMEMDAYYALYKKFNFLCLWITSVVVVTCYVTIDDLIFVWLGSDYVFEKTVTLILCVQLYLNLARTANGAFIGAAGLFVKDKIRPVIEAVLNLGISIFLTYKYGIAGVFLGTIISLLVTSFWREPYLLYRYSFKRNVSDYWKTYFIFVLFTVTCCAVLSLMKTVLFHLEATWISTFGEALIVFVLVNLLMVLILHRCPEYQYMKGLLYRLQRYIPIIKNRIHN